MKLEKQIAVLTESGGLDILSFSLNSNIDDIEQKLSDLYPLDSIQWMEVKNVSLDTLRKLNVKFGCFKAMKNY